jgi:hypothetical protein
VKILDFPGRNGGSKRKVLCWAVTIKLVAESEPRQALIPLNALAQGLIEVAEKLEEIGEPFSAVHLDLIEQPPGVQVG